MSYQVNVPYKFSKFLSKLTSRDYQRVKQALIKLQTKPRAPNARKLTNRDGWRIRVGKLRIIYEIDDKAKVVDVLDIDYRKNIYR